MDPVSTSAATPGSTTSSRQVTPRLDAINLMLRDLHTRHDEIRHRAAFRGCTSELLTVQQELVDYLLRMKNSLQGAETPNSEEGLNYNSFT
ncbi:MULTISPECIES: hypothetical protein [unclassified Cyanobium]|uniref:hypothetical protein n=1 Tax=unclassified Cyanobium TaxID=2627006 RepID=UPI0020CE1524|nr:MULTISPECIES: hypothetical protein [unclassified Cyanobium]MCP9835439.1 hypothetical protein [Cyanobium sp. La Preciosa 7G6]MCP9938156.1 hypothetical protein [Cyanobium sp. Aljojuca 7A6]